MLVAGVVLIGLSGVMQGALMARVKRHLGLDAEVSSPADVLVAEALDQFRVVVSFGMAPGLLRAHGELTAAELARILAVSAESRSGRRSLSRLNAPTSPRSASSPLRLKARLCGFVSTTYGVLLVLYWKPPAETRPTCSSKA